MFQNFASPFADIAPLNEKVAVSFQRSEVLRLAGESCVICRLYHLVLGVEATMRISIKEVFRRETHLKLA